MDKRRNVAKKMPQIKFTISADIVSGFKTSCQREGISMTAAIRQFMETTKRISEMKLKVDTRPQRRKAVRGLIIMLDDILTNELAYRDNIPDVFEQRIETAEHACDQLAEALACLEDAFSG
jgi:hypothetical protein